MRKLGVLFFVLLTFVFFVNFINVSAGDAGYGEECFPADTPNWGDTDTCDVYNGLDCNIPYGYNINGNCVNSNLGGLMWCLGRKRSDKGSCWMGGRYYSENIVRYTGDNSSILNCSVPGICGCRSGYTLCGDPNNKTYPGKCLLVDLDSCRPCEKQSLGWGVDICKNDYVTDGDYTDWTCEEWVDTPCPSGETGGKIRTCKVKDVKDGGNPFCKDTAPSCHPTTVIQCHKPSHGGGGVGGGSGGTCGNGTVDGDEECDEGENNTDTPCIPEYNSTCTYCNTTCSNLSVTPTEYCDDDIIQIAYESCDNGTSNGVICSVTYGGSNCSWCDEGCAIQKVIAPFCGDGNIQSGEGELCDDGSGNADSCTPDYNANCTYCNNTCNNLTVIGGYCGDSLVQNSYEDCDDGNDIDNDSCPNSCMNRVVFWKDLLGNPYTTIREAHNNDTVIMDSTATSLGDRNYTVWEEDLLNADDFFTAKHDNRTIVDLELLNTDAETHWPDGDGEFYCDLRDTTDASISLKSGILKVTDEENNSLPTIEIDKLGGLVKTDGLKIVAGYTFNLTVKNAGDIDDFINVSWLIDGVKISGGADHFAKVYNSTEVLATTYTFPQSSTGTHSICANAIEEKRGQSVSDCVSVELLKQGVTVDVKITSPLPDSFEDKYWIRFDARESSVYNCSDEFTTGDLDISADLGSLKCKYLVNKTGSDNTKQTHTYPGLGTKYNLTAQWLIDDKPITGVITWDSLYSNGYASIFDRFFAVQKWYKATLNLEYKEL